MTAITLDRYEALEKYGYREDTVGDRRHYIGRDEHMRAIIGPVRHRAKSLFSWGRTKKAAPPKDTEQSALRFSVDHDALRRTQQGMQEAMAKLAAGMQTIDFSKMSRPAPPPQKVGMLARFRTWVTDRFYDEEWHRACRSTAASVLMWAFAVFAVVVFVKGMVWVVSL